MYLKHFGMQEMPFSITPDTGYFYNYGAWQDALNVLLVGLRSGEGFIKISGEVGTGKTLLCRKVLNTLGDGFITAFLPNPCLTPACLRMALANELGINCSRNMGQHYILKRINERLIELNAEGKQVVLLLDEAQALPNDSMEALRLLTNLESEKSKLLQVVLFGQPELDTRLSDSRMRQLRQRISFSFHLNSIDESGIDGYLAHRLFVAGYKGHPLFTTCAVKALHHSSQGIPRVINILAHKSLMVAWGKGCHTISEHHIRSAVQDTESAMPIHGNKLIKKFSRLAAAVLSVAGTAAAVAINSGV